nr:MAG TPA: tail collar fiber protein [Caudoviricetes sp.]
MRINISKDYSASADCDLLGYIGETNARTIEVEQPEVERADCYRLRFAYPDGVVYDVPLADGITTVDGSLLREAGHVKCQWLATAADGDNYRLVAKSNVFALRVEGSISDDIAPVPTYEQAVDALDRVLTAESSAAENADKAEQSANAAKAAENAVQAAKADLETATSAANIAKATLETATTVANTTKSNLDSAKTAAETAISSLNTVISQAATSKINLEGTVGNANTAKSQLQSVIDSATSNLEQLRSENFNSKEILAGVANLEAYLGITTDVLGLEVDYENKTFRRLAGAVGLSAGTDFDAWNMFGGRKRCNVSNEGTITAYYGDPNYKEDGSNGQVMVYQPKFYYLVCPVVYDVQETGIGYHLRKANYYVSEKARAGFRLHPAFYDANGNEIDYILLSAYEGSIYDTSASAYLMNDEQVMSYGEDLFSSIAGAKPASGLTQNLTRPNIEQMAQNRGIGWHGDLIKAESANQLLMIIELGAMNTQNAIGLGLVSISDDRAYNCSSLTGSTSSLGNSTGIAASTINEKGGVQTTETAAGKVAVTYRGMENPWGNIWKSVYGINFHGNGNMGGGQPYICNDFNFAESKNNDNYIAAGFTVANTNGYISAMGYSTSCDWLFLASETLGNSSLPVGDYIYVKPNLYGYKIALLGGVWYSGSYAGGFYWYCSNGVGARSRTFGGRLVYVPTKK